MTRVRVSVFSETLSVCVGLSISNLLQIGGGALRVNDQVWILMSWLLE